jgi:lactoylglutathione lyase
MQAGLSSQTLKAFDHVGIRVTQKERSIQFYERLGFSQTGYFPKHEANEMTNAQGLRINLIFNASARAERNNILLDQPIKWAGFTHPAFVVENLYQLRDWLIDEGITITEDIHPLGPRRITLFIRDPDGNVLEFNQLTTTHAKQ